MSLTCFMISNYSIQSEALKWCHFDISRFLEEVPLRRKLSEEHFYSEHKARNYTGFGKRAAINVFYANALFCSVSVSSVTELNGCSEI